MKYRICCVLLCSLLLGACSVTPTPALQVDVARIEAYTHTITEDIGIREAGSPAEWQTGDWIIGQLQSLGFADIQQQTVYAEAAQPFTTRNILVTCNPDAERIIAIVAHYDSVPTSPGARDNAASVAALLEIARLLGEESGDVPCQVRLVFLGGEEVGYWGSRIYVQSLPQEEIPLHLAVFNMDIAAAGAGSGAVLTCNTLGGRIPGGYREGTVFDPVPNLASRSVGDACLALYPGLAQASMNPLHYGDSDHISFHEAGIDAANICWRREQGGLGALPEEYHKMTDTADTIDYSTIEATANCILYAAGQVAQGVYDA